MAILNFPDNPQLNAQYTGDNGTTYIFDGVKWVGHAVAQPAGTNSITNNGFTLQMGSDGNLIIPTGSHIYYQDGTPLPDAQGPRGATGPEGPRGLQGAKGDKGDTGLNGENGLPGQNGLNGTNGINGVGQKGDKGDKGDTGAQGVSVTLQGTKATIADLPAAPVNPNDFAGHGWIVTTGDGGTHADGALWFWNLALAQWDDIGVIVGPKGDKGDTGERGLKGDTGENGTNGQNGLDGENGINGLNGEGVPTGGTIGQLLFKVSSTDFDTEWNTLSQSFAPNARTGVANTFVISPDQTNQVAITGPYTDVDHQTAQRLVIAGRDSYYDSGASEWFGEGGDLYLWAGKGANGGDIKVDAGEALGLNGDEGGTIKIRSGGSATGNGGFLEMSAGNGAQNGGDISITSGYGQNTGGDISITAQFGGEISGKIILQSGGRPWTFNPDGSLSGPSSGATLNFGAQPLREPSWGSKNELITLYDFNTPGQINYGIGVSDNAIWMSTDTTTAGFKWFGGEGNLALDLKGTGELNIINNIRQGDARINLNENGVGAVYLTPTTDDYSAFYLARDNAGLYTQGNITLSNVKTRTSLDVVNIGTSNDNTVTISVSAYSSITQVTGTDWTMFYNNTNYSINSIAVDTPSAGFITFTINGNITVPEQTWVTFHSPTIWNDWNFDANGDLTTPYQGRINQGGTSVVNVQSQAGIDPHAPFVIYTSQRVYASSIKMVIQIEGWMDGDDTGWHSQACEALVSARGAYYVNGSEPHMTVYGVVYTGASPMANISIRRNQLGFIEVLATYTQTRNNGLNVSVHATEMLSLN